MTAPVYLLPDLREYAEKSATVLRITGEEARHAVTVRRTRVGEEIDVCDGDGLRARCVVTAADKAELVLQVNEYVDESSIGQRWVLVQALAKGGRDEQAVDMCTEYGVHEIIPWFAERAVVSWKGKETKRRERWQSIAQAAAKQSRRSWLPRVASPVTSESLADAVREATGRGARVYLCHEEASTPLSSRVREDGSTGDVWVIIGPEGGISPEECELLEGAGAQKVLLAPHVLRSSTAGAYAFATIAAASVSEGASAGETTNESKSVQGTL
ncbi:MAG: 16S rRNA (uracil(1498)-N(3))-methyltransferase [Actinomycetaceae bacterium]|nr:16S rRNA (uracil(1498)-N(3))-methyltransferase [Actinomycetaceae bacterium]